MMTSSGDNESDAVIETPEAGAQPLDGERLVKVNGQPLEKLPEDLYIPPDALEVFLEAFEGPLDLLLFSTHYPD